MSYAENSEDKQNEIHEQNHKNYEEYYNNYDGLECEHLSQKGSHSVFPETVYYGNAYIPFQQWNGQLYSPEESLCTGTIFPELNQPYEKGGRSR